LKLDGQGGEQSLPSKATGIRLTPAMAAVIETPGAGGYGSPTERNQALLNDDVESGKFSPAFISAHYRK
jgi:N-methylhydantoinase B